MLFKIPFKTAAFIIIGIGILLLGFHLLVMLEIIPYSIVWGSRLNSYEDMLQFELVALILNTALIILTLIKMNYKHNAFVSLLLWAYAALFILNSFGNMLSKNMIEMLVFTPLTIILALLCARIAMEK